MGQPCRRQPGRGLIVEDAPEVNDIAVLPWLEAWLSACAANGGHPPEDLGPWLPWTMDEARRAEFRA